MAEEPETDPQLLATLRRCTFARRVFTSRPSLWAKHPLRGDDRSPDSRNGNGNGWHVSRPYTGEPFDPEEWELRDGGWDHEHCDVCWSTIGDGLAYWPNADLGAGHVDLCEACYPRVRSLLGAAPGVVPGAAADGRGHS